MNINNTYIQYNLGFGQVQMGANGCGWVRMGAIGCRGVGEQENKASMHIYWYTTHAFRPYGREISPKNHIHAVQASRWLCGCIWSKMGADGCSRIYYRGESAKQHKNIHKWDRRTIFGNACPWQQNKANFRMPKKSVREYNKDDFGQARVAKDCICK